MTAERRQYCQLHQYCQHCQGRPMPRLARRLTPRPVRPALTVRRHVDLARVASAICSR